MPETTLPRRQPSAPADLPSDGEMSAALKPPMARFILRGDAAAAAQAGFAFGAAIPTRPLTSAAAGPRAALWLGPDEWLLLAPIGEQAVLARAMETALAGAPHSLVDVSHRQVAFSLRGRLAARALTSGCPLDLSAKAFPPGMAARTLFHKAEIVLWREPEGFHLEVWRSFAPYVAGHLAAARKGAEGLPDAALP